MNKKIFLAIITASVFLAGCGRSIPTNTAKQDGQPSSVAAATNTSDAKSPATTTTTKPTATISTSDAIDYNQYIKKTWIVKDGTDNGSYDGLSFRISKIVNGEITGYFGNKDMIVPNHYNSSDRLGYLNGTINKDTAECKFSDKDGNKGNIKLIFKQNNEIEAAIKFTDKSQIYKDKSMDGTFQFIPYNLNDMKGFSLFKDQSFTVDLNSWGNVRFVSGKVIGGNHIPTLFYLTDKDGDILYDFAPELPYSVDVKAVSFQDVNKDGLKDIIIIVADAYHVTTGTGESIATVYFQKADGSFNNDPKLDQEINASKNNKTVKTVTDYLSKK